MHETCGEVARMRILRSRSGRHYGTDELDKLDQHNFETLARTIIVGQTYHLFQDYFSFFLP